MSVSQDATSLKFVPASSAEWASFINGLGLGGLLALYQCQDASSPVIDSINAINLAGSATGFQQTITGWTRKGIEWADGSGAQLVNTTSASLPDLHTTSQTFLLLLAITNTPAANRSVATMGPGGTAINNVDIEYNASDEYRITDGTNTGVGTINHGTTVVPALIRYNKTAGAADLFVGYTPEKISKTFVTPAAASKGLWIGSVFDVAPTMFVVWAAALAGANAELTDAQVTGIFARFTTGYVASIALTPTPVTIAGTGTQQMTATATMGDSSTQDVSSNANTVWTSSSPSVATVSATGLVTAIASGTTTITAAFGGATSPGISVSVSVFIPPTLFDPVPGNIGLVGDSLILLHLEEPLGVQPADSAGNLDTMNHDTQNEAASVSTWEGHGRSFDGTDAFLSSDLVAGSTLALFDVSVQVILGPNLSAFGAGAQTIIQRGIHDGTAPEAVAYGLELIRPSSGLVTIRWYWEDSSGTIHRDTGATYQHPGDDELVLLTATRRWDSTSSMTFRYYAADQLIGENVSGIASIAGGATGHTAVGASKISGTWSQWFTGVIDCLRVVDYEMSGDEVRETWRRLYVYQPNGVAMFAGLSPPGARWYKNPGNSIAAFVKTVGELLGYAAAKAEELRENWLPDQAYIEFVERWESVLGLSAKPNDSLDTQRARVIAFLSRLRGYSIPAIEQIVSEPLGLEPAQIQVLQYGNLITDSLAAAVSETERWQQATGVSGTVTWSSSGGVTSMSVPGGSMAGSWADAPAWLTTEIPRSALRTAPFGPGAVLAQVELTALTNQPSTGNTTGLFLCDRISNDAIWFGVSIVGGIAKLGYRVYSGHAFSAFVAIITASSLPIWLRISPTTLQDQTFNPILSYSTTGPTTGFTTVTPSVSINPPTMAGVGSVGGSPSSTFTASFASFAMLAYDGDRPFNWFVFRDPSLGGTPDITGAQLALDTAKPAHTRVGVCQNTHVLCNDTRDGLCDRAPMGGL